MYTVGTSEFPRYYTLILANKAEKRYQTSSAQMSYGRREVKAIERLGVKPTFSVCGVNDGHNVLQSISSLREWKIVHVEACQ
jgi:hypothetical protein